MTGGPERRVTGSAWTMPVKESAAAALDAMIPDIARAGRIVGGAGGGPAHAGVAGGAHGRDRVGAHRAGIGPRAAGAGVAASGGAQRAIVGRSGEAGADAGRGAADVAARRGVGGRGRGGLDG